MDLKSTFQAISSGLRDIDSLLSDMIKSGKPSSLDIELAMDKLRNIYDVLHTVKNTEELNIEETKPEVEENKSNEVTFDIEETQTVKDTDMEEEPEKESATPASSNKTTISDRFKDKRASLHDNLAQVNKRKDVSSKLQSKPIIDIKKAIGLNEKFSYIKNLFKGNNTHYEETIELLNHMASFNDAYNYLLENFNWNMDDPLVQELLDIIRRKYITSTDE